VSQSLDRNRRNLLVLVVVVIVVSGVVVFDLSIIARPAVTSLPAGCVKPTDGFLIIASNTGYNDSVGHGAPSEAWPVINVTEGQTVNIVVCNTDVEAHGFQISHYYDGQIESVGPGQVMHVSFVATETGNFQIFCAILCEVHPYMQSGMLRVSAS
jgi:hypothetical protein